MKVLIVSNMYPNETNPSYGIFVERFCKQLEKIGVSYEKSVMYKNNSIIEKIIKYLKFYFETILKIIFNRYDLIYVHYASHSAIPVLMASKIKKVKVFTNVHGSDIVPESRIQEKMQIFTYKLLIKSEKIIVPSEYFKKYVSDKYKLKSEKIYVYSSAGIESSVFYKQDKKNIEIIKSKIGIHNSEIVIGFVGRLIKGKGLDTFVKALDYLYKHNNDLKLKVIIVGSGTEEYRLKKLIESSSIKDITIKIDLLSEEKLALIYNCLNLFIFPTEREGESLGLVALEAMSCGVPVIASNFAAAKYYVENGYNGYKYKVGDYKDLSNCIKQFISLSGYERYIMSENSLDIASKYFNTNIINELQSIFYGI